MVLSSVDERQLCRLTVAKRTGNAGAAIVPKLPNTRGCFLEHVCSVPPFAQSLRSRSIFDVARTNFLLLRLLCRACPSPPPMWSLTACALRAHSREKPSSRWGFCSTPESAPRHHTQELSSHSTDRCTVYYPWDQSLCLLTKA